MNPSGACAGLGACAAFWGTAPPGDQPITGHWEEGVGGNCGFPVNLVIAHLVFNAHIATGQRGLRCSREKPRPSPVGVAREGQGRG